MLVAALGQGRDTYVQMNAKQWRATAIWWRWFISIAWNRLRSVAALVLAEPVLPAQQVQRGVEVRVYLVDAVADGLEGGPPVGGLVLFLPTRSGQQQEEEERGAPGGRV